MGKQFAVFGLGSFGKSVALTLQSFGCDVIAVDNCYEKIQDIADSVSYAMCGDVTEPEFMKTIGARNLDGAVIAVSENLEAAIMATMISKEMGISYVLVKAMDELQGKILEKVGADSIVYPEIDMGERVAKKLISTEFIDWIELSPDYSLTEKLLPKQWEGKSLAELRVREKYGINVIGILKEDKMDMALDPSKPLQPDDMLFIIGKNSDLEKFKLR
ncbi:MULTISPECIES: TrkA family potassium uptake protein [Clostridia]|jgi:trk system potassium uptake protein TrkA|uniref:TrkA family potassium uptake protein n=1 Tax=Ruminococcus hominis TaxID=2763065 RepID=A0ABR7G4D3_9FIRM|nr:MULTISPECIES: TrkA family potassium uptake protein [Clostridia]RGH38675.1 TrkA family potassium uptake protein [Firmicutes bacterium AM41-5BH]RHS79989.1 TrkA family potassium uptake protein [Firmicutes bacterium AM43-11BH]RHT37606.1 TrkA family potassium uptake protein [Firmicutes bacterium AM31-12AC]RHV02097.1 TrkA family potassium uptake protein [Firmicutes bacterium OM07-11]MBC5682302.1 TrkA family potassium uptake protein [Ruminococcus hominis]